MRAIVDTNVIVVADGRTPQANDFCRENCIKRLLSLKESGRIVLDDSWIILNEYLDNVFVTGQMEFGGHFLLWVLQNWQTSEFCELFHLAFNNDLTRMFLDFPTDIDLEEFDPNDRKYVALALVSNAPIWNAVDSDWYDFYEVLSRNGIRINFLCTGQ